MAEYMTLGDLRDAVFRAIGESPLGEDTVVHLCRQEEVYRPIRRAALSKDKDGAVFLLSDEPAEVDDDLRDYRVTVIRRYERSFDVRALNTDHAEQLALEAADDECIHEEMLNDDVVGVEEI